MPCACARSCRLLQTVDERMKDMLGGAGPAGGGTEGGLSVTPLVQKAHAAGVASWELPRVPDRLASVDG